MMKQGKNLVSSQSLASMVIQRVTSENIKERHFKYYTFMSMVIVTLLLVCHCVVYKPVNFLSGGLGTLPASAIVFSLCCSIFDLMSECYGYKLTEKILFTSMFCNQLFFLMIIFVHLLPPPDYWSVQEYLNINIKQMIKLSFTTSISFFSGTIVSAVMVSRLKIRMKGKNYWARAVLAIAGGHLVTNCFGYFLQFYGERPLYSILDMILSAWFFKTCIASLLVFPNCILAKMLKKAEGVDIYDYNVKYLPGFCRFGCKVN